MASQNHSVARKRLSTLAITTTLAAVGVGVVGTGAANAATGTPQAHSQDGQQTAASVFKASVTAGTGATSLSGNVNLTGTTVDPSIASTSSVTINWDGAKDTQTINFAADGTLSAATANVAHPYAAPGKYTVTVTLNDGSKTPPAPVTQTITVTDVNLAASLSATSTKKNSPVTLSLAGSSVDQSVKTAVTTVNWGDNVTTTFPGDPSLIKAGDAKLSHSYAADKTYTVTVTLSDGAAKPTTATQSFTVKVSETGVEVLQAAGATRYETGVQISQHQWADAGVTTDNRTQAKSVVLATGNDFADALVAVPLAKKAQGPLLLTDGTATTVNDKVLTEIKRILPKGSTVLLLGGNAALNVGIENELDGLGYTTHRLAGEDRFQTALQVAESQYGMNNPSHVIVARGDEGQNHDGFADALAAGPYAANVFGAGDGGSAVVLSNFNTFDAGTAAYVNSKLKAGQQNVAAIGGQAAAAMTTIKGSAGTYSTAVGHDRYETAEKVAAHFLPNGKTDQIGVATGLVYPDALTGGAYMATVDGPLLLTDPHVLPAYTADAIAGFNTQEINIFGGDAAISPKVAKEIAALVKVSTIGKF
ncbi:putative cell wall-binding protein [Catenulispora sp. GP43]|uniref:cell wall-binding repeat-containing protein n=1 Tax=Catenulispora sp. GP43 TaxID=3156263 RepID=UPI0035135AB0